MNSAQITGNRDCRLGSERCSVCVRVYMSTKKLIVLFYQVFLMFRNECTVTPEDALFYRHVIVFTPFATTTLGLAAICLIALWDYNQKRRMLHL